MNETLVILAWIGDILALIAAHLITKGKRSAFAIFVLGDLCLMGVQIEQKIWSQMFLFMCFTYINAKGWFTWKGVANQSA